MGKQGKKADAHAVIPVQWLPMNRSRGKHWRESHLDQGREHAASSRRNVRRHDRLFRMRAQRSGRSDLGALRRVLPDSAHGVPVQESERKSFTSAAPSHHFTAFNSLAAMSCAAKI